MKSCFLYKITNTVNGKMYIGISSDPHLRWYYHRTNRAKKTISIIQNAIDKYGEDNFSFDVLCEGSRSYIQDLERRAIKLYNTIEYGYNIRSGGEGGSGHVINKRIDDKPVYVTGFWFPNPRTALNKLTVPKHTLYKWFREGSAGKVFHEPQKFYSKLGQAVYVGGFWFHCITVAADKLNQVVSTLRARIYKGFIEAGSRKPDSYYKIPVMVDFIRYESASEAARVTDYTKKMIYTRLNNNTPGFSRIEET